jgi:5-methylcytosine-specific restriction protein A
MPYKSKRPCGHPGCPNLTSERYCETHKPLHPDRPPSAERGYNSRWRKLSKAYLRKHPLCVKCMQDGRYVPATVVDHITPHRGNEVLMWGETNWQALCKPCHDRKTWTEDKTPVYSY